MMNIDFIQKYDMLPQGTLVLCAVSGGKDSMFLLEKLCKNSEKLGITPICAHFDHRLRGEESDRDRRFVENYCAKKGINCHVGEGDVRAYAKEKGLGIEAAARLLRYEFLEKTAEEIGADRIATAHTADDNAETFLLNLLRGTGLKGLCAIPPVRGKIIRPMLETSAETVLAYLAENGVPYVEDSTNFEDDYLRNRLRHRVIPPLREGNTAFDDNISRCISHLREDEAFLASLAADFLEEHFSESSLCVDKFLELAKPISARVLQNILGGGLAEAHIDAIFALARSENPHACADVPNCRVQREYARLIFGVVDDKKIEPQPLKIGEISVLETAGLKIIPEFIEKCVEIHKSDNTFFFQSDSICGKLVVTARREGDSVRLDGRGCTKTIKKLFSEKGLNGTSKNLVPVFRDEEGIVAVYGFGIAERCAPKIGDDVLKVTIIKI